MSHSVVANAPQLVFSRDYSAGSSGASHHQSSYFVIADAPTICIPQRLERGIHGAHVIAGDLPAARVSEFAQKAAENPAVTAGLQNRTET